jgi:hypothetical protein
MEINSRKESFVKYGANKTSLLQMIPLLKQHGRRANS